MSRTESLVAGVDGCRGGWVAAIGPADGSCLWLSVADDFASLVHLYPRAIRWAVDMPIGLTDDGVRNCDAAARERLGPQMRSSVFSAPPRCALNANDYSDACQLAEALGGKKVSKQCRNLFPKIRDVRNALLKDARLRRRVFETHPELCFGRMHGAPVTLKKKSPAGRALRERLLANEFDRDVILRCVEQTECMRHVAVDDTLDAIACWTAAALDIRGETEATDGGAALDATGLSIAMRW